MEGHFYIQERQRQWALRRGIDLIGSRPPRGNRLYTPTLEGNLFQPLSHEVRQQFAAGDGNELGSKDGNPGKMQAVHSSSALAVNVFHYWQQVEQAGVIAQALRLPASQAERVVFEAKWPICSKFRYAPNIDVVLHYAEGNRHKVSAIECKFTEAYNCREHCLLDPKYLKLDEGTWDDLPSLRKLAERLCKDGEDYPNLYPAQLVKHILGLRRACGHEGFRLLYLWYDVPGPEGASHREQAEQFGEIASADGISFQSMTYQELIIRLAGEQRNEHPAYVDYLSERYL